MHTSIATQVMHRYFVFSARSSAWCDQAVKPLGYLLRRSIHSLCLRLQSDPRRLPPSGSLFFHLCPPRSDSDRHQLDNSHRFTNTHTHMHIYINSKHMCMHTCLLFWRDLKPFSSEKPRWLPASSSSSSSMGSNHTAFPATLNSSASVLKPTKVDAFQLYATVCKVYHLVMHT